MVEFDVQLSKDMIPVIYHDFHVSISMKRKKQIDAMDMLEIPVKDLTLEQLHLLKVNFIYLITYLSLIVMFNFVYFVFHGQALLCFYLNNLIPKSWYLLNFNRIFVIRRTRWVKCCISLIEMTRVTNW